MTPLCLTPAEAARAYCANQAAIRECNRLVYSPLPYVPRDSSAGGRLESLVRELTAVNDLLWRRYVRREPTP